MQVDFELLKAFYKEAYEMGYNGKMLGGSLGKIDQPEDIDVAKALLMAKYNLQEENKEQK